MRYEGRRDLGLLFSEVSGGTAAFVCTTNLLKAAPLLVTRESVEGGGEGDPEDAFRLGERERCALRVVGRGARAPSHAGD